MPVWGTGPRRTDGQTNPQIRATPYTQLPANYPRNRSGGPLMGYRFLPYSQVVSNYGLWYDAMDTSTIKDTAGNFPPSLPPNPLRVVEWRDKSANARHLTNHITQPSFFNLLGNNYYPNVNSRGYTRATDPGAGYNNLRGPTTNNPPSFYNGSSITAFFVLSIEPNATPNTFFALTSTANTQNIPINPNGPNPSTFDFSFNYISNTIGFSRFGGGGQFNPPIASNNVLTAPLTNITSTNLITIQINPTPTTIGSVLPSTNTISINGAFVSSSTRYAGNPFNFCLYSMFGAYNFPANSFSYFNEVGIFFRTLTTPERVAYQSQLIRKWAIPSNAPITYINNNPVTNGLYFNIDAYDPTFVSTTVTSDGLRRVDTVLDKSGNNRHFKFTTGFSNIFYNRVSTMNQYNSLYFSTGATTAGVLSNINPINTFSTNSYSFFLVYNQLSTQTNTAARILGANNQSGSDVAVGGFSYQIAGQTPYFVPREYQFAGATIINGRNYLYSLINNGGPTYDIFQTSTFYSYHNFGTGAALTCNINLASTNLLNISQFNIGGRNTTPQCFNGLISEVLCYNRGLLNSERLSVENYLINKWGISTLVSNVPVTSGLNLWLDCYDPATMTFSTNTTQVTQWRDKSISSLHFSNALTNNVIRIPSYTTNPANSLPGLLFSNTTPTNPYATGLYNCNFNYPVTREATIFTVAQWSSGNASFYSPVFCMLSNNEFVNNTANSFTVTGPANGLNVNLYRSSPGGFLTNIANTLDRPTLVTGIFNSTFTTIPDIPQNNSAVGRNGVIGSRSISSFISTLGNGLAVSTVNFNVNQAVLGLRAPAGGDGTWYHSGYIHEVLLYNRALNFSERQQVESYLMSKWNI